MSLPQQVDEFVSRHLPRDFKEWCAQFRRPKIVHDALWGTHRLQPHEIVLLDTPLLQRLRELHQTGAVYLTYPSAHHTRFEHTLGVVHQAGKLFEALRQSQPNEPRLDPPLLNNVRYAALLHDTGHGPFSHTSEQFFSSYPEMESYKQSDPNLGHSGAGEILSYLITTSQPMREFIDVVNQAFEVSLNCDTIGQLITGTTPPNEVFMSEIVHGPFDADKLDYMPRDGMFSGLKMHVDMDRLYHSIRVVSAVSQGVHQTRIAGHLSGLSPLTQIMFNKMLLYTGMYHHHKVRAVDCMLWAIFHLAREGGATVGGVPLQSPVDYLRVTDDRLLIPELCNNEDIRHILSCIRERRLWRKAIVIARNTVPPSMHSEAGGSQHELYSGVVTLAGDEEVRIERRREIARMIWEAAGKPCGEHEVWLDVPKPPSMTEAKKMWICAPGQEQPQTLEHFVPVDKWVELYGAHQSRAHVFSPSHVSEAIGEAAKKVFYEQFRLEFLPEATAFAAAG